jgi:uncharacterized protein YcaQ
MSKESISLQEARRIALGAQGFDQPRPTSVAKADVAAVIRRLGLVQLDFVNVTGPAHYQVIFSRLGKYDRKLLDDLVYRSGEFTEQWAHEASIVPIETWPLLRFRMATFRLRPYNYEKIIRKCPGYPESVLEAVRARGPLTAAEVHHPEGAVRRIPGSWHGSVPRATLEAHFARGLLAIADRLPTFARVYELAERRIAHPHFTHAVPHDEARRRLLTQAARACGVGTAKDLADYFRMKMAEVRPRLTELVEGGELREVRVEGWREAAYMHKDAVVPKKIEAVALLAPFDPLVWFRPRLERLFAFDYRFEIFVPDHKRKWGTYVLPFLYGERLVARVDLKADREAGRLQVVKRFYERGCKTREITAALDAELAAMAAWTFGSTDERSIDSR